MVPFFLSVSICCSRIFPAQQPVWRFVLLNGRKTTHRGFETVVVLIIIGLGNLTQQRRSGSGLDLKIMVKPLMDMYALSGRQTDKRAGRYSEPAAVTVQSHGIIIVDAFVRKGVVDPD